MPILAAIGTAAARGLGMGAVSRVPPQVEFTVPGTYTWIVPAGVTTISAVCVGSGGAGVGGDVWQNTYWCCCYSRCVTEWQAGSGGGGGGGGLIYTYNAAVTPGQSLQITVGAGGTTVGFQNSSNLSSWLQGNFSEIRRSDNSGYMRAYGGSGAYFTGGGQGGNTAGSNFGNFTGAIGGSGGGASGKGGGGGGAAGYGGSGGNGVGVGNGSAGTQGGGGGGAATGYYANTGAGGGGGVGIYGRGSNGAGGFQYGGNNEWINPAGGGSGGSPGGGVTGGGYSGAAGAFGGGGAGGYSYFANPSVYYYGGGTNGAHGAVRIIWGAGRAYPSTNTANA